jgi:hypothetical protein
VLIKSIFAQTAMIGEKSILKKVDEYRLPGESLKYFVSISTKENENEISRDNYNIMSKGDRTLIELLDKKKEGQKILIIDTQMWIKMPRSKRVIRVTPMQRLTGQAHFSDLARIQFDKSYETIGINYAAYNNEPAVFLNLKAKKNNETYYTVDLIINAQSAYPLKADFYLRSGKKFKSINFLEPEVIHGRTVNTRYIITDDTITGQSTEVAVSNIELVNVPDSLFSISYLEGL